MVANVDIRGGMVGIGVDRIQREPNTKIVVRQPVMPGPQPLENWPAQQATGHEYGDGRERDRRQTGF